MRLPDSATDLYCVIGSPIKHSLSPLIHNKCFEYYHLNAVYLAFEIDPQELGSFFRAMRIMKIKGCNVTLPHKINCLQFLDEVRELAQKISAVNTIKNEGGKLIGYNTDYNGILEGLNELKINIKDTRFLVLGAGGAGRTTAYTLACQGAKQIYIANRSFEKAKILAEELNSQFNIMIEALPLEKKTLLRIADNVSCIINATSVGIKEDDPLIVPEEMLRQPVKVYDLTYYTTGTPLVKKAQELKLKAIDGIPMLIYQAIASFKIWHGIEPSYQVMYEAIADSILRNR